MKRCLCPKPGSFPPSGVTATRHRPWDTKPRGQDPSHKCGNKYTVPAAPRFCLFSLHQAPGLEGLSSVSNVNDRWHFPIWKPDHSGDRWDQRHRAVREPRFLVVHTGAGNPANVFNNQKATSALSPITAQAAEGMRNRQHMAIAHHNFASSQIFTQSIMTLGRTGTSETALVNPIHFPCCPVFQVPSKHPC